MINVRKPARRRVANYMGAGVLVLVLAVIWCASYHRWTSASWSVPLLYETDALAAMAGSKLFARGEILPVLPKSPSSLGAPFHANWNDFPIAEEAVLAWTGMLMALFGVFTGANASVFTAHLLAGGAFYYVCRRLRYDLVISIALAVVFSFSRYAFSRSLLHLGLTYYWHIPLGLLVVWWCMAKTPPLTRRKWALSIAVAVLHGIQHPYYAAMFVQLLGWAAVCQLMRRARPRQVLAPLLLIAVAVAALAMMNADRLYARFTSGPNSVALERNYASLELYALKPIELLLPVVHHIRPVHTWARESYYAKTMLPGEAGSPYLGIIGIVALAWLVYVTVRVVTRGESARNIPSHFWLVLWVLAYSVVGGVNGIVGFAVQVFRGTNRYSIVILALVLLFLVRQLTRATKNWSIPTRVALAAVIVAVGLFDQVPPALRRSITKIEKRVLADREIVRLVESKLTTGAMLFQMPVADFPEVRPIEKMSDYEHFRPFLHSSSLRYSYGSVKGRSREAWQHEAVAHGAPRLIATLESYGFGAIWINRDGYADQAAALVADLRAAGRGDVIAENAEFVCIRLDPSDEPNLPPEFASGWHRLETAGDQNWRWSSGAAELVLHHRDATPKTVQLVFEVNTLQARRLQLIAENTQLAELTLHPDQPPLPVKVPVLLTPGTNRIRFATGTPGELPANGDPRALAFSVRNFRVLD